MTDQEIVQAIKRGQREQALKVLYKEYPKIRANILSNGGDDEIARQIFHDSLILIIEKVNKPDFELTAKMSTFLYGINHFLWKNELRKRRKSPELEWKDTLILTADEVGYDEEKEEQIKALGNVLNQATDKCKQIFDLFYFKKQNMTEIAEKLGFTSVNSAKTQKYKCLEKAIKLAKETTHNA